MSNNHFPVRAVICEQLTAGCTCIQPLHVANLMTWQGQFCPFLKKIKISICVFPKASFPHLSSAAGLRDSCAFGDSCAFNSVVAAAT